MTAGFTAGVVLVNNSSSASASSSVIIASRHSLNRGGFTGQIDDLMEHAHVFTKEVVYQLLDGFSVQFGGFFSLHTRISGTYHGANDTITAENLHVAFRTLRHLKELLAKVKIENEGIAGDGAYIDEIIDVHTESLTRTKPQAHCVVFNLIMPQKHHFVNIFDVLTHFHLT